MLLRLKYLLGGHKWLAREINRLVSQLNLEITTSQVPFQAIAKINKSLSDLRAIAGVHYDLIFEDIKNQYKDYTLTVSGERV